MIYGPVIMNAEVISYRGDWENVTTAGISHGREGEKALAKETYPQLREFQEVTQKGILYTLEDGQTEAVIQDLTKAAKVPDYPYKPLSDRDYISYVLVVDKEFAQTEAFSDFIDSYNKAVEKLNNRKYLAKILKVDQKWLEKAGVEFLPLQKSGE